MEGDAGAGQLNSTGIEADDNPDEPAAVTTTAVTTEEPSEQLDASPPARREARLGRGWLAGVCAALLTAALGAAAGGYLALRSHDESEAIARADAAALQAAKDCVAATHAPDAAVMSSSQAKIVECSTGDFGAQAALYSGMLVEVYQAANAQVQVSEMRAAVERHRDDGTIDVLVAVRVKVTNSEAADREQGYRLRVQMAPADGTFKVARLDQVAS